MSKNKVQFSTRINPDLLSEVDQLEMKNRSATFEYLLELGLARHKHNQEIIDLLRDIQKQVEQQNQVLKKLDVEAAGLWQRIKKRFSKQ